MSPRRASTESAAASTPQRVHLERRRPSRVRVCAPGFNPTTGSSGTPTDTATATATPLQPHNGFIWNESSLAGDSVGSSASTPQRVHLERVRAASITAGAGELQPHNGFIWNEHIEATENFRNTGFNPTTGSSGTSMDWDRTHYEWLQPHNGFIWNYSCASSVATAGPLQPHNGFIWNSPLDHPGDRGGGELQPHNGFIWNGSSRVRASARRTRFNPTTGSSGTTVFAGFMAPTVTLQPHNGFIWNNSTRSPRSVRTNGFNPTTGSSGTTVFGRGRTLWAASTPQRVHLEQRVRCRVQQHRRRASTPQRVHLEHSRYTSP